MIQASIHLIWLLKEIIAVKAEVDQLEFNILNNFLTRLNNLKTKADDFDVVKLKTVPVDLKTFSDEVKEEVLKKTVYDKLNTKVNNLENKILDATTLI